MRFIQYGCLVLLFGCSSSSKDIDVSGDWGGSSSSAPPDPFGGDSRNTDTGESDEPDEPDESGESDESDGHYHDHEVITTVALNFTPHSDGDAVRFEWAENDDGPEVDDIVLQDASDYTLTLEFLNELEDPIEDVTPEIADEQDEYQVFITGSAVVGSATRENPDAIVRHYYGDADVNGLPIGLINEIMTLGTGNGDFQVTLRHMPLENGNSIKTETAASDVANEGFGAIGGDNDVQITFSITVE